LSRESILEQLDKWVEGNPVHNTVRDECCPDFSCCRGKAYLAPRIERLKFREAYLAGNEELVNGMLMMFLGAMLSDPEVVGDKKVYLAGDADMKEV
jgi:hypothetical protein